MNIGSICKNILMTYSIEIDSNIFIPIEVEAYLFDRNNHKDPFVLQKKLSQPLDEKQISTDTLFFHDYGVDITIGKSYDLFGGILIRGLKDCTDKFIYGPIKSQRAILNSIKIDKNYNSVITVIKNDKKNINIENIEQSVRIIGRRSCDTNEEWRKKEYRFFSIFNTENQKEGLKNYTQKKIILDALNKYSPCN